MKLFGIFLQRYGVLCAFVLLFAWNAARDPGVFLQPENLRNLVNQNVGVGIIAIGMTLVIITGGIDLSVGSMLAFAAALGITALNKTISLGYGEGVASAVAVFVSIASGTLMGAFNGVLVAYGRVAPFVATLAGFAAYRSLCLALADGGEIRSQSTEFFPSLVRGGIPLPFVKVSGGEPLMITWGIVLFFLAALFAGFILNYLPFGRHAIATGSNERAAIYSAIDVASTRWIAYTLLGFLTGIAAFTQASRMNSVASGSLGNLYELDAIAAVVIGGTSLRGGKGRIWGTVVGVLLLGIITNMLVVADVSVHWQGVVKGSVILAAVLLQREQRD